VNEILELASQKCFYPCINVMLFPSIFLLQNLEAFKSLYFLSSEDADSQEFDEW
jgi:hypothetical protein